MDDTTVAAAIPKVRIFANDLLCFDFRCFIFRCLIRRSLLLLMLLLGVCETIFIIWATWLWAQWHSDQAALDFLC